MVNSFTRQLFISDLTSVSIVRIRFRAGQVRSQNRIGFDQCDGRNRLNHIENPKDDFSMVLTRKKALKKQLKQMQNEWMNRMNVIPKSIHFSLSVIVVRLLFAAWNAIPIVDHNLGASLKRIIWRLQFRLDCGCVVNGTRLLTAKTQQKLYQKTFFLPTFFLLNSQSLLAAGLFNC